MSNTPAAPQAPAVLLGALDLVRRELDAVFQPADPANELTFDFILGNGKQSWAPGAITALEMAGEHLASNFVVASPVTVDMAVRGFRTLADITPEDGDISIDRTLAAASSPTALDMPGFIDSVVQYKVITGIDANGPEPDGNVTINFAMPWGFDQPVTDQQYDFDGTMQHELLHALGFDGRISEPGTNVGVTWGTYDQFITDANGNRLIDDAFKFDSTYDPLLSWNSPGALYFDGPNAVAAYGGPVPLYTTFPYSSGSALYHVDERTFNNTDPRSKNYLQMMNPSKDTGPTVEKLSRIEIGILEDIGYTMR